MVTFYVEVDGGGRGDAFTSMDAAQAWATANLGPAVFYTLTQIGPSNVGSALPTTFKTPDSN